MLSKCQPFQAATRNQSVKLRHQRQRGRLQVKMVFTGIVQGKAEVVQLQKQTDFSKLQIQFPAGRLADVKLGASVAINGVCLTVTAAENDVVAFDVMVETLRATTLGGLNIGSNVNFERAAKVGDEIGGHNVSGHVHCTAEIAKIESSENNRRITFQLPDSKWMKYILPKGYIAVDGASLTIGEVWDTFFTVYLIPETIRVTVLGDKSEGSLVNIEIETQTQAIVDTVERVVSQYMKK